MRRQLTLHIGVTKTGSTSIQHVLARSRTELAKMGVSYPKSPGTLAHHLLPALVTDPQYYYTFGALLWDGMPPTRRLEAFRQQFGEEMDSLPDEVQRCVISTELLGARLVDERELWSLRAFLDSYFSSYQVIVYLRRQDSHMVSNFNQHLREGLLASPDLPKQRPLDRFTEGTLDYHALLTRYEKVFGRSAIVPRVFERQRLVNGDVVDDFLEVAGLRLDVPNDPDIRESNPSVDLQGQSLMLAALSQQAKGGGGRPVDTATWRRIADLITKEFPGRGWQPAAEEARQFLELFADGNERVRQQYFPDHASLFDSDFTRLPAVAAAPNVDQALAPAITLLLRSSVEWNRREAAFAMDKYRLLRKLRDREGMRGCLQTAIRLHPDLLVARVRMAELCLQDDRRIEAREHAEAALAIKPGEPQATRILAELAKSGSAAAA